MSKRQATVTNTLTTITNLTWGQSTGTAPKFFIKGILNDYDQH